MEYWSNGNKRTSTSITSFHWLILNLFLIFLFMPCILYPQGLGDFKESVSREEEKEKKEKKEKKDKESEDEDDSPSSRSEGGFFYYGDIAFNVIHFGNPYLYSTDGGEVSKPQGGYALIADMQGGILENDINEFVLNLKIDYGGAGFEINNFYFREELDTGETDSLYIAYINGFVGVGEENYYFRCKFGITHIFGQGYTGGWNLGVEQSWYPGGRIHINLLYEVSMLRESLLSDFFIFLLGGGDTTDEDVGHVGLLTRASASVGYAFGPGEVFAGYTHFLSSPDEGEPAEMFGLFGGVRFWV